MRIDSIAVLGPGLLGGSLLHDARRLGFRDIRAWARKEEVVRQIRDLKLADIASTDLAEVVRGASFLVLATPVGAYPILARQLAALNLDSGALITDVGSVKAQVLETAGCEFRGAGLSFIGSHPMAGSEATGLDAAQPNLFQNAACILTPEADADQGHLSMLWEFWEGLGCRVSKMAAEDHDQVVARISHMPHLAAAAVTLAALRGDPTIAQFAAGGLRDTTRVASGDPSMWSEILLENRDSVLAVGRDLHRSLGELLEMLEKMAHQPLLSALEEAKRLRETRYPAQSHPKKPS